MDCLCLRLGVKSASLGRIWTNVNALAPADLAHDKSFIAGLTGMKTNMEEDVEERAGRSFSEACLLSCGCVNREDLGMGPGGGNERCMQDVGRQRDVVCILRLPCHLPHQLPLSTVITLM